MRQTAKAPAKEIAIYLEGGGPTSETQAQLRLGMSAFLQPIVQVARAQRARWSIIPCSGRSETFEAFCHALKTEPNVLNFLLVDAEELLGGKKPWAHLAARPGDKWTKPAAATDDHCHLMVTTMETWFLADVEALKHYYGKGFNAAKLAMGGPLENAAKTKVAAALAAATRDTAAKEYGKIRDGAKLLAQIKPELVRKACPHCERLFATVIKKLQ